MFDKRARNDSCGPEYGFVLVLTCVRMRNMSETFEWRWSGLLTEERSSFGSPRLRKRTESRFGVRKWGRRAACTLLSLNDGGEDAQPPPPPGKTCRTRSGGEKSVGSKVIWTALMAEDRGWRSERCAQLETSPRGFVGKHERCYSWSSRSEFSLSRLMTGSGWASVLNTQCSNGRWSSSENSRYRYLTQTNTHTYSLVYTKLFTDSWFIMIHMIN